MTHRGQPPPFLVIIRENQKRELMQVTKKAQKDTNFALEELAYEMCQEHLMSGEAFWTLVECYSTAKAAQLKGEVI